MHLAFLFDYRTKWKIRKLHSMRLLKNVYSRWCIMILPEMNNRYQLNRFVHYFFAIFLRCRTFTCSSKDTWIILLIIVANVKSVNNYFKIFEVDFEWEKAWFTPQKLSFQHNYIKAWEGDLFKFLWVLVLQNCCFWILRFHYPCSAVTHKILQ